MEKLNSSNYRKVRRKSIALLWALGPNAKLIMSSKALAFSLLTLCVCVLREHERERGKERWRKDKENLYASISMHAFLAKFACIFDVQSACLSSLSAIAPCVYLAVFSCDIMGFYSGLPFTGPFRKTGLFLCGLLHTKIKRSIALNNNNRL